ncbi:MAG: hypothetical protein ACO1QB_12105 [Verrucomicrobiales bacterium]
MPPTLRVEYLSAISHVVNLGNHLQDIVKDDFARHRYWPMLVLK